jgi:hypothetical protein
MCGRSQENMRQQPKCEFVMHVVLKQTASLPSFLVVVVSGQLVYCCPSLTHHPPPLLGKLHFAHHPPQSLSLSLYFILSHHRGRPYLSFTFLSLAFPISLSTHSLEM